MSTETPRFAFCEPVTATATSKEHIRRLDEHGLQLGGGATTPTLCGRDLRHGWDLSNPVTPDMVTRLVRPRSGDGRVFLCGGCATAYLAELARAIPAGDGRMTSQPETPAVSLPPIPDEARQAAIREALALDIGDGPVAVILAAAAPHYARAVLEWAAEHLPDAYASNSSFGSDDWGNDSEAITRWYADTLRRLAREATDTERTQP